MQLNLLNFEPIKFGKCGTDTYGNKYKSVKIDIDEISQAVALWDEADPTVRKKVFEHLMLMSKKEDKCRIYITFTAFDPAVKTISVNITGNALEGLQTVFGSHENIKVQLSISQIIKEEEAKTVCGWCTKSFFCLKSEEMLLERVRYGGFGCIDDDINFPKLLRKDWFDDNVNLVGKLYITLIADCFIGETISDKLAINRKILNELQNTVETDLVIVSGNGKAFNCHRSFLSAHSPVFDAMLKSNFVENKENRIELLDLSENSMKAFLAYIYCWDIEEATNNSAIAFDLLKTAHKYEITGLESSMLNVITSKPTKWINVDVAMDLFFFSRCLKTWENITSKAIRAMNIQNKKLEQSAYFQQLFRNDPESAMQLCIALSSK
ncbi:unnamed protein product [Orchesella dallaii]|uniref:BTB domain-containing protein n=1 Tax=Orchesella dallaii TaxID=48710 RepID=A0ABP1RRA2_9HEXA